MSGFAGERLTAYKIPRVYQVCDALPKGTTGKILKRAIDLESVVVDGLRPRRSAEASAIGQPLN